MEQTPNEKALSSSEAAAVLGVHPDTLVRWSDDGKVRCWRTPGGHRRWWKSDLTQLMATEAAS